MRALTGHLNAFSRPSLRFGDAGDSTNGARSRSAGRVRAADADAKGSMRAAEELLVLVFARRCGPVVFPDPDKDKDGLDVGAGRAGGASEDSSSSVSSTSMSVSDVARGRGRSRRGRAPVPALGWTEKSAGGRQRGSLGPGEECADVALDAVGLGESGVCVRSGTAPAKGGIPPNWRLGRAREPGSDVGPGD